MKGGTAADHFKASILLNTLILHRRGQLLQMLPGKSCLSPGNNYGLFQLAHIEALTDGVLPVDLSHLSLVTCCSAAASS